MNYRLHAIASCLLLCLACGDKDAGMGGNQNNAANNMADAAGMNNDTGNVNPNNVVPDMSTPDMAAPDMAAPDMVVADMAGPDLSVPDMAVPDMSVPDLGADMAPDMAPDMAVPPSVMPLYPGTDDFMSLVMNDGTSAVDASGTACSCGSSPTGPSDCLRAGEIRMFDLSMFATCANVTISDALGVFDWVCDESTGSPRAISTNIVDGKGLTDLIDFANGQWLPNVVTATDGTTTESSPSGIWWQSPIVIDNDGGTLDASGTVYVVTQDTAARYQLTRERVGLVLAPGVTVTAGVGETGLTVVSGANVNCLWVEGGTVDADAQQRAVYLVGVRSVLRNLTAMNANAGSNYPSVTFSVIAGDMSDVVVMDSAGDGVEAGRSFVDIRRVSTARSGGWGLELTSSAQDQIHVRDLTIDGSVRVNNTKNSLLQRFAITNGTLRHENSDDNIYEDISVTAPPVNQPCFGGDGGGSYGNVFHRIQLDGTGGSGNCGASFPDNSVVIQLARNGGFDQGVLAGGGAGGGIIMGGVVANVPGSAYGFHSTKSLHGVLSMRTGTSPTAACGIAANNGSNQPNFVHNAAATLAADSRGVCVPANRTMFSGILRVDTTSDCRVGATLTDVNLAANCVTSGGVAVQIGGSTGGVGAPPEFALAASDTTLRGIAPLPTGNDTFLHFWKWTSLSNCNVVDGAVFDAAESDCYSVALLHSYEQLLDGIGNDNGLCESNETCVYMPNIGAYQGDGPLIPAGTIGAGGAIENVTLLQHMTNGR